MKFECKCGNADEQKFTVMMNGNQKGLYCSECGKWQKWLNKTDINIIKIKGIPIL